MRVLGLSFSGHGSSACLVDNGHVVAAVNLERLTRVKNSLVALPEDRLATAGVLQVMFGHEKPPPVANVYDVLPRLIEAVSGEVDLKRAEVDLVVKTSDNIRPRPGDSEPYDEFCRLFDGIEIHFDLEHHLGHAYQAYLSSPWDDTAILTIDGRGENLDRLGGGAISTSMALGSNGLVKVLDEIEMPHSVGAMYAGVTKHLGFGEEQDGNTMALAAFGTNACYQLVRDEAFELVSDGKYRFHLTDDGNLHFMKVLAKYCPPRERGGPLTQQHYDMAWAVQSFAEEIMVHVTRAVHERTGRSTISVAGGVGLNCVANTKVLQKTGFEQIYVSPNAGDRGLALGSALYGYHVLGSGSERHPLRHDYLGPTPTESQISGALASFEGVRHRCCDDIAEECASLIAAGRIIGWVQGGAEFGPRALGHRSILADPRTMESKRRLDEEIKRREWFRPYAPSILVEHADEYFEMLGPSPYMLMAVQTRMEMRDRVPAIVHVDGSARVQTVDAEIEPRFHRLISCFYATTGVPLVLNTSLNGYGEPIVESPHDAVSALLSMGLDALAVGDHLVWAAGNEL